MFSNSASDPPRDKSRVQSDDERPDEQPGQSEDLASANFKQALAMTKLAMDRLAKRRERDKR